MPEMPALVERYQGSLLGLMLGDCLGAYFEGWSAADVAAEHPTAASLLEHPPLPPPWPYTDDTEMAIGVAEALLCDGGIQAPTLAAAWVRNYTRGRPYGATRMVLEAMLAGADYLATARDLFPGGSYGNGAAMRVAPIGLYFHRDLDRVWDQAALSAMPTHPHPLAVEGAQIIALAVALAVASPVAAGRFDRDALFDQLQSRCQTPEFRAKLAIARGLGDAGGLAVLGNGVRALDSVVTAVACFACAPDDCVAAVTQAIFLGGDTDTIGAMTGAIAGARCGVRTIPARLLAALEDGERGKTYVARLAEQLASGPAAGITSR